MKAELNENKILARKLELHYYFNDKSHYMDAIIRNRCEHEFLEIVKHISALLDVDVDIESEAYLEGGLKEWWTITIKKHPTLAAILIAIFINVISNYINTDKELTELQKEELKLNIEYLKQEINKNEKEERTINIEEASSMLNNDIKIQKHKSNFYKTLNNLPKIIKIETRKLNKDNAPLGNAKIIERSDFGRFIIKSDELPSVIDEEAIIEIVSPVLKRGKYKWKGIYKGDIIDFYLKDKIFKDSIYSNNEAFKNGSFIECVLEISKKIDDFGDVKKYKYSVSTVINKDDGVATVFTKQGKEYKAIQLAKKQQFALDFDIVK